MTTEVERLTDAIDGLRGEAELLAGQAPDCVNLPLTLVRLGDRLEEIGFELARLEGLLAARTRRTVKPAARPATVADWTDRDQRRAHGCV
jgi:hypothetical protein